MITESIEKIISISQIQSDEDSYGVKDLTQFYRNNNYSLLGQEEQKKGEKNSKDVIQGNNSLPIFTDFPVSQLVDKIFPQLTQICHGKYCSFCENGLTQLLHTLKSFFITSLS